MNVLVLRAQPAAAGTARVLARLGHQAVVAPLIVIGPAAARLARQLTETPHAAVIAASTTALDLLDAESRAAISGLKALVVGRRTEAAAAALGLDLAAPSFRTAAALAAALEAALRELAPKGPLLYLAGHDRKPEIEAALRRGAHRFTLAEVYAAKIVAKFPGAAVTALRQGDIDAVLHYSARSAAAFFRLAGEAGIGAEALNPRQLCLSAEVAQPLITAGAKRVESAHLPDEAHLLALLARPSAP